MSPSPLGQLPYEQYILSTSEPFLVVFTYPGMVLVHDRTEGLQFFFL